MDALVKGQPISGIGMGPAPQPWDVVVPAPKFYTNHVHKQEVPNTASVKVLIIPRV